MEDLNTQKLTVRVMDDEMIEKSEYMGSRQLELKDVSLRPLHRLLVLFHSRVTYDHVTVFHDNINSYNFVDNEGGEFG